MERDKADEVINVNGGPRIGVDDWYAVGAQRDYQSQQRPKGVLVAETLVLPDIFYGYGYQYDEECQLDDEEDPVRNPIGLPIKWDTSFH